MNTGKVFQHYRESKGFSVSDTCQNIVSPQFLRKFENGNSDISYTNLSLLLQKVGVTTQEFTQLDDKLEWGTLIERFDFSLGEAIMQNHSLQLENLIKEFETLSSTTKDKRFHYLSIVAKSYLSKLISPSNLTNETSSEIEILDFLRSVDYWTSIDYYLASNISLSLSPKELFEKCELIFSREFNVTTSNIYILDYVTHIPLQLASLGNYDLAKQVLDTYLSKISALRDPKFIHFDLFALFVKGVLLLQSDAAKGEEQCSRIIEIFSKDLGYTFYANRLNITFLKYKQLFSV